MGKASVSVTIEHGFIKVLVCEGRQVAQHRVVQASPQFFREGSVRDTERIGGMVHGAFDQMGISPREVIGVVPGFQTSLRLLELPRANGLDPQTVIPREAARSMGVSQETSILTWRRLPSNGDRTRWLVLSAARRAVSAYVDTISSAGARVRTMELRPFALARAVNQSEAIIAWVALDGCEVVIVRDAVPAAHQTLFWGAEPVEGLVLVYRLTEILERTIASYDTASTAGPLPAETAVFVCGSPIGVDPAVAGQVAESLQRPAGRLEPPVGHPADFPVNDFIVNLGLALREAS